ncbi:hypothetical protein EXU85_29325 [Spirosoma sp. KCTC 42546]|uniref:prenyltransferase/squalene oxidase repeat-containing protein n=1 Tax=Spirosoma sp. KCTC 42546 TaxID=2520506 RepID=UPI0011590145|nr:hypothetical protein [Spirosoma sp. KCTC 42546]QDK82487.1 hypothetical protein EXU85_29325 [Spirosoma sp. KCTC 42546]
MRSNFSDRISRLPVNDLTMGRLMQEGAQQKHIFYLNLIDYVAPVFDKILEPEKEQISFAGYLYFRFLLEFDAIVDTVVEQSKIAQAQKLNCIVEIHEAAIRELALLFPTNSSFWLKFNKYKNEYGKAVLTEKHFAKSGQLYSEATFEQLAAGKSAVCYAAIQALVTLNGCTPFDNQLERCLRHIHIAFQYLDDIDDFEADLISGQRTFAHQLVQEYLTEQGVQLADEKLMHKYLYLSNVGATIINKAISHFEEAINSIKEIGLTSLEEYLITQVELAKNFANEIDLLIKKTRIKSAKSSVIMPRLSVSEAADSAFIYLTSVIDSGTWSDFITSAGSGDTWITAYTGRMLAECGVDKQLIQTVLEKLSAKGSFNGSVLQDADSTNFLVGLHWQLTRSIPDQLLDSWLLFRNEKGGWATYQDEDGLRGRLGLTKHTTIAGWLSAHDCVSAAAAYILSDIPSLDNVYESTCRYLTRRLVGGGLHSYWWTSDLYTLSFTALAFAKRTSHLPYVPQLGYRIAQNQHPNGYWVNPIDNQPNAFYTAIALKALIAIDVKLYQNVIQCGINWLLMNQTKDGSWQTSHILRIPATNVLQPETVKRWRKSSFGVNTLVDDHNRVFTTSTVFNILTISKQYPCLSQTIPAFTSSTKITGLFTQPKDVTF